MTEAAILEKTGQPDAGLPMIVIGLFPIYYISFNTNITSLLTLTAKPLLLLLLLLLPP